MALLFFSFLLLTAFPSGCKKPTEPPPSAGPDITSHDIQWVSDSMGYFSSRLLDVWGPTPTSVYTVGLLQTTGAELPVFVTRYNGSSWMNLTDDSLSWWIGAGLLAGVHGVSDSVIFVAGSSFDSRRATAFVGKWNGRQWTNISPDDESPLVAIWAKSSSEVYAGGDSGTVLRYDGKSWTRLETGTELDVWQITGVPTGEVYAIASDYFNSFAGSVVLRIEGNTVTRDQFFPVGRKFGIWGTFDGEAYATGEGTFHKSLGSPWMEISTPNPRVALWSVTGTASNNVLVVGSYGAVIHWNGESWKFYEELYDKSSFKSYFKAFAIGDKYFLVGNTPTRALITIGTRSPA